MSLYVLGYVGFVFIVGFILDGLNRKKVMVLGMSFFVISIFFCGIVLSFLWMLIFRFLVGVSVVFVFL